MTYFYLLFNCVVFFVLFGCVICPPKAPPPSLPSIPKQPPVPPIAVPPKDTSTSGGTSSGESTPSPGSAFKKLLTRSKSKLKEIMKGKEMVNVTLIRHHMNDQTFRNGLVESSLHWNGWFWHYYQEGQWENGSHKSRAVPLNEFELFRMRDTNRIDKKVTFKEYSAGDILIGSYSLIFQEVDAARKFTGEVWTLTGG